jgi:hypothetical protein
LKRQAAEVFVNEHQLSIQRACGIPGLSRTACYRVPTDAAARDAAVIAVLNEISAGYRRESRCRSMPRRP